MEINEKMSSALFNVGRLIKQEVHKSKCLCDFTMVEMEILKLLYDQEKMTMKSIADYLHIKPSSATSFIDNLIKKRTVKRVTDSKDRRIVYIKLTPFGFKSFHSKHLGIHKTIEKIFDKLNNKDKKQLIKTLEKISYEKKS